MSETDHPHVVVLAGGEGKRLAGLTRALYGIELPKQFAVLEGDHSLMQSTIERALALTSADRISVVVTAHHESTARAQLAPYPGVELIVQPHNLDTAVGMLLPLVHILARRWDAHVMFLPSDHYIANAEPLAAALRATAAGELANRVSLVGVAPTAPETDYGWIIRGDQIARSRAFEVSRFEEKPPHALAEELWRSGGLWNTFIQAGAARVFWEHARRGLPHHTDALSRYAAAIGRLDEQTALEATYASIGPANFSRDVLGHVRGLAVLPDANTGWSDWGSPQRVFASLAGSRGHQELVERIRGDVALAG